ncbi:hypothetical protein TGGT1_253320 [Toxoplasma gondii GT1]|nr:hypothetical protein TGGT1_253320 [Toxoplasma gondii GT1]KAF4645396.1 hypothetical protein TGRH88_005000 [Toxoplasma gondii]KFG52906.1 hypothetical protein TGFOU_253320 [Toxoplasma gondii FOU]
MPSFTHFSALQGALGGLGRAQVVFCRNAKSSFAIARVSSCATIMVSSQRRKASDARPSPSSPQSFSPGAFAFPFPLRLPACCEHFRPSSSDACAGAARQNGSASARSSAAVSVVHTPYGCDIRRFGFSILHRDFRGRLRFFACDTKCATQWPLPRDPREMHFTSAYSLRVRAVHIFPPKPFRRNTQHADSVELARPPPHLPTPNALISPHRLGLPPSASSSADSRSVPADEFDAAVPAKGETGQRQDVVVSEGDTRGKIEAVYKRVLKMHNTRRWFHHQIWTAMTQRNWTFVDALFTQFLQCGFYYDEVTYTLKLFYFLLSHRTPSENAMLVLEEMKVAKMHPAIVRMNEGLLLSYFELGEIFCLPPAAVCQNLCRVTWQAAVKLQRQRKHRLKRYLEALPPNVLLGLTQTDVAKLLSKNEEELLLLPASCGPVGEVDLLLECSDEEDEEHVEIDDFGALPGLYEAGQSLLPSFSVGPASFRPSPIFQQGGDDRHPAGHGQIKESPSSILSSSPLSGDHTVSSESEHRGCGRRKRGRNRQIPT